jgi:hypothetical protein
MPREINIKPITKKMGRMINVNRLEYWFPKSKKNCNTSIKIMRKKKNTAIAVPK